MRYRVFEKLMNKYPDDHIFIYIDADAIIVNQTIDIRKWIPKKTDILLGNNDKMVGPIKYIKFGFVGQSGIIIIKNTDISKKFIDNVLNSNICEYVKTKQILKNYDQSCISMLYKKNKDNIREHIKIISVRNPIQKLLLNDNKNKESYNALDKIPILHFNGKKEDMNNIKLILKE